MEDRGLLLCCGGIELKELIIPRGDQQPEKERKWQSDNPQAPVFPKEKQVEEEEHNAKKEEDKKGEVGKALVKQRIFKKLPHERSEHEPQACWSNHQAMQHHEPVNNESYGKIQGELSRSPAEGSGSPFGLLCFRKKISHMPGIDKLAEKQKQPNNNSGYDDSFSLHDLARL